MKVIIPAQIDVHAFLNEVHHEKPDAHQQFRVVNFHVWGVVQFLERFGHFGE